MADGLVGDSRVESQPWSDDDAGVESSNGGEKQQSFAESAMAVAQSAKSLAASTNSVAKVARSLAVRANGVAKVAGSLGECVNGVALFSGSFVECTRRVVHAAGSLAEELKNICHEAGEFAECANTVALVAREANAVHATVEEANALHANACNTVAPVTVQSNAGLGQENEVMDSDEPRLAAAEIDKEFTIELYKMFFPQWFESDKKVLF